MDLEIAKQEFLKYTNNYDLTNFQIKRKIDHSLRVMDLIRTIAESLNLSQEEINIATLIGLLHDIGRFEQMKVYKTFNDEKSIDHGDLGVEILQKDNYIRNYIKEEEYDNIIFTAIKNHNKFIIEEGLDYKKILFSKLIRDADKLDILYQGTCITWSNKIDEIENEKITKEDIQPFIEKRMINRSKDLLNSSYNVKHILTILGFTFGINYDISYKILKEKDYMNKIIDRFKFKDEETKKLIEEIRNIINTFIDSKQKG